MLDIEIIRNIMKFNKAKEVKMAQTKVFQDKLNSEQAYFYLTGIKNLSKNALILRLWRLRTYKGLPSIKIGKGHFYSKKEIDLFIENNKNLHGFSK